MGPNGFEGLETIRIAASAGSTIVWLEDGVTLRDGTIELAVRGRNVPQQSFVGVAFHALDEETYDAIYFRPFNFRSDDPSRRSHMVQYISHPDFPWQRLREEHPDAYESEIRPAPDPDVWIHARIVVERPRVSVFVNTAAEPSLVVEQLAAPRGAKVGLWAGPASEADFAGIQVSPA